MQVLIFSLNTNGIVGISSVIYSDYHKKQQNDFHFIAVFLVVKVYGGDFYCI